MISITNANSTAIQAPTGTTELRRFKTRAAARLDAVATIGPHARDEFEFSTRKIDGSWVWEPTDPQNIKAETAAQLKANGGKKSILAMAMAIDGKVAPVPSKPMTDLASLTQTPAENLIGEINGLIGEIKQTGAALAPSGNVVGFQAGDDIPDFLRRPPQTEEQKEAIRKKMAKTVGPDRVIKNPPDTTAAQKRAEKQAKAEAKFEGTPAHAKAKKAEAKQKAAKEAEQVKAVVAKKNAKTSATKVAGTAGSFATKAALIKAGITAGHDDDLIVKDVNREFPGCNYQAKDVKFYRRKMGKA